MYTICKNFQKKQNWTKGLGSLGLHLGPSLMLIVINEMSNKAYVINIFFRSLSISDEENPLSRLCQKKFNLSPLHCINSDEISHNSSVSWDNEPRLQHRTIVPKPFMINKFKWQFIHNNHPSKCFPKHALIVAYNNKTVTVSTIRIITMFKSVDTRFCIHNLIKEDG